MNETTNHFMYATMIPCGVRLENGSVKWGFFGGRGGDEGILAPQIARGFANKILELCDESEGVSK